MFCFICLHCLMKITISNLFIFFFVCSYILRKWNPTILRNHWFQIRELKFSLRTNERTKNNSTNANWVNECILNQRDKFKRTILINTQKLICDYFSSLYIFLKRSRIFFCGINTTFNQIRVAISGEIHHTETIGFFTNWLLIVYFACAKKAKVLQALCVHKHRYCSLLLFFLLYLKKKKKKAIDVSNQWKKKKTKQKRNIWIRNNSKTMHSSTKENNNSNGKKHHRIEDERILSRITNALAQTNIPML